MAENAGAIIYTVDMDTAAVTKGADRVNAALDSVGKGADRLDDSMARTGSSMSKAAKATDEEAAALRKLLGQIDPTVAATQRLDQMTEELGKAFDKGHISAQEYTANLAKLDAQYNKLANSTDKATSSTKKADSASSGFATSLKPLAAAIAGVITVQTLAQWGKMAEQFTLLQSRITRLSADADTASKTYQQLLNIASATGQTLPNTVKLWETLSTSLKALGATNDQVVTLTGTLQKIGKIGGSSAEETSNALRQLGQSLAGGTLRAEEYNSIVEQTPELVRQLAAASGRSMGEFRQAMLDGKITSQELLDLLLKRVPEVDAEFKKLPRSAADAGNAVEVAFGAALSKIDQALGASQKLAAALDGLAKGIQTTFNPTDVEKFNQLLRDRATAEQQYKTQVAAGLQTTAAATQKRLEGLNAEIKAMQDARIAAIKAESGGPGSGAKSAPTTSTEGQKAIAQLAEQNQQLRAQGVERAKIIALQKLGAGATQQEKDAAVALAVENFNLQEAEKKAKKDAIAGTAAKHKAATEAAAQARKEEAERRKAQSEAKRGAEQNQKVFADLGSQLAQVDKTAREVFQDQAQLSLNDKFATPDQIQRIRDLAGALYDARNAKQALAAADPIAGAQLSFDEQLKQLQALNDQKLLSDQRYLELKGQAERAHAEEMRALQEETFRQASVGNDLLIGTLNSLQQASSQAFVGLVTGATDGRTAVQQLAGAILNQGVNALLEMGFAQVKSIVMGQAAQATATAAGVGQAATLTSAYTPAAAAASVASFGGAAVAGLAAMASAVPAMMGLFGGGRQYGGPVDGSKMYRVNEGGAPEIFNAAGGKQYMMPNTRGEVVSNKDATSTGAAPQYNVNIIESSDRGGQVEQNNNGGLDVFVAQIRNGGEAAKTLESTYGLKRVGR